MTDAADPMARALAWRRAGEPVAVATVVETWGSAPRKPGSKLVANQAGEFFGSVSGGCVEAAVIEQAADVLAGGPARLLEYGVADETAWEVGLACGGTVRVWLEPAPDVLEPLAQAHGTGRPVALATEMTPGGRHCLVEPASAPPLGAIADDVLRSDVGAVHIAQPLAAMAAIAGFAVVVVDPRTRFASDARFAGIDVRTQWPDEELADLRLDTRTAVVALTHDPKLDDPALLAALASPAFYVGALGGKTSVAARAERLRSLGVADADVRRVFGPVGLDIGGQTPAEIAASIVAQVIAVLRGRSGR